ncbi:MULTISPECIES: hypothetical protein [unclassified Roseovarius]|uniref:hypothetical protein n=1 Tax=unclassified Roseovarius TaxID=2614913 RepID=UPI00273DFBBD|nr:MULTISPECIES: hypothetical protein [unclassified Roseovarius]
MTDEDRLSACLIKNRDLLSGYGTEIPNPGTYRKSVRILLRTAAREGITEGARDVVMQNANLSFEPERLILSGPSFFGTPKMAASGAELYSSAEARIGFFLQMFPNDRLELFIAIRNPATFLPAVLGATGLTSMTEYLRGGDPTSIRWSHLIERLNAAFPDIPLTVWCNEDTPLIWAQIMREMAGLDPTVALEGEFALLEEIMTEPGLQRFNSYVGSHPGMTEIQKRRVIAAFLDKFADEEAIEEELDVPGWTEEMIDHMTELYDEDVYAIERMSGVNLITP